VNNFLEPIQHFNFVTKPKQAFFEKISGQATPVCSANFTSVNNV